MISNNIGWFSLFKEITNSGSYKSFEELVQFLNEQFFIFKNFIPTLIFKLSLKKKSDSFSHLLKFEAKSSLKWDQCFKHNT